jgi:hypothetical protein
MKRSKRQKKIEKKRRGVPWPRKYIPSHKEGSCPYCHKRIDNIEEHIKDKHKFEKPMKIKGKVHGHE